MLQKRKLPVIGIVVSGAIIAFLFLSRQNENNIESTPFWGWFGSRQTAVSDDTSENFGGKLYVSPLGYSFRYPSEFKIGSFDEGEGYVLLGQNEATKEWFQFFITEFDESEPLTVERIKKDLPNLMIENPVNIVIGQEKNISALLFSSKNQAGQTREVWFSSGGYLFQASTVDGGDGLIGPILDSFAF